MPRNETVSTLHRPTNEVLSSFKFLQKKDSWLEKKFPTLIKWIYWFCHLMFANFNPQSYKEVCQDFFFLQKFEKWENVVFGPHFQASRASPAQKSRGFRVIVSQKLFKSYIFLFSGQLNYSTHFELFVHRCPWKKLEEKAQCATV